MIHNNLGSEIYDFLPQLHAITYGEISLRKNISPTEEITQRQKYLFNLMHNGKLNEDHLSTRVSLYENLKSIQFHLLKN